jgi:hypothetical protein
MRTHRELDELIDPPSVRMRWVGAMVAIGALGLIGTPFMLSMLFPVDASQLPAVQTRPRQVEVLATQSTSLPEGELLKLEPWNDMATGLRISAPSSWIVTTTSGSLIATADSCGSTGFLAYPFSYDTTQRDIGNTLKASLERMSTALPQADRLTIAAVTSSADQATVRFTGKVCATDIVGIARTTLERGSGLLTLRWSPATEESVKEALLLSIERSFAITRQAAYLIAVGDILQIAAPETWTSTAYGTTVRATLDTANAHVFGATLPKALANDLSGIFDAWIQLEAEQGREFSDLTTRAADFRELSDRSGRPWQWAYREITYTINTRPMRAVLSAATTEVLGDNAFLVWRSAPAATWDDNASLLLAIERSLSIPTTSPLLAPPSTTPVVTSALSLPTWHDTTEQWPAHDNIRHDRLTAGGDSWNDRVFHYAQTRLSAGTTLYFAPILNRDPETNTFQRTVNESTETFIPITQQ